MALKIDKMKAVFLAALDRAAGTQRAVYLDEACAGDAALRRSVEALLRAHDQADPLLDRPAAEHLGGSSGEQPRPDEGLDFLDPPARPDSLGRIGHYEVLEVLGKGGFGIVFRALDEALERVVAVKVLAPQMAATSPARKRFLREARSSARVRHQNVVQVYAVEEQPLPYLVMEFIPGETLQQRLDRTGPLEVAEVLRVGRQIAEGLAAAHATGLIHRDVKPANIMIEAGPHPFVKLTDFGLARAADDASLTQSGTVAGTPMYMSPEQANGEPLDHRADLFSLGSVLYTMLSGRPPFRARNTLAVLKRVAEDTPRPIPEIIPEVPPWLCQIIAKLHAKNPDDRFVSAQEVADLFAQHPAPTQHPGSVPAARPVVAAGDSTLLPESEDAAETVDIPEPQPEPQPTVPARRRWALAAGVFLLLLGGVGVTEATGVTDVRGTVIRLVSPDGTLVVEVDDPEVSVQIDGSDVVITGAGAREIRVKPGRYTVEARRDGKVVSRELVTVARNGRQVVRVTQEAAPEAKADPSARERSVAAVPAVHGAWVNAVALMPADKQVESVSAKLKELNPGFDGTITPTIENGVVTGLTFSTDQISDVSPVCVLRGLRSLECSGSDVGQGKLGDLSLLKGLPLTSLNCRYNGVSDLAPLSGMNLTALDLRHTNVGDAAVKHLAGMKDLQWLSLWGTKVTDAGLKGIAGLKNLKWLSLETTQVTDEGLKEIAGLHRLEHLSLYHAVHVTDAGLEHLVGLKALRWLDLRSMNVTDEGARKLASALPALRIEKNGGAIEPR